MEQHLIELLSSSLPGETSDAQRARVRELQRMEAARKKTTKSKRKEVKGGRGKVKGGWD